MKGFVKNKLDELLRLKRFPLPSVNPEDPDKEVVVVTSDLPDAREAGNETFKNKDALKKDNLFSWDKFKKVWVTEPENLQAAQERVNQINKKEEFIQKIEDLDEFLIGSNAIADEGQLENKLSSYIQDLANATDEKAADAAIRRYFTFQGKFHTYSFSNTILILIQKPNATKIAGKSDWKTKHKRYVVAGAIPIWVFAPKIMGGKKDSAGDEGLDKEIQAGRLVGFKAVQVFDISDTKPFDENAPSTDIPEWFTKSDPTETTQKLYGYVEQVLQKLGITLTTGNARGGENGYSAGGHINMTSSIKGAGEVSTLIHELAHELMHWKDKSKFYNAEAKPSRAIMELQAESVAYTVMKHYNIPVEHHATYISLWKGNKKEILHNIEPIQKVSKFIITNIDEVAEGDQLTEDLYL